MLRRDKIHVARLVNSTSTTSINDQRRTLLSNKLTQWKVTVTGNVSTLANCN